MRKKVCILFIVLSGVLLLFFSCRRRLIDPDWKNENKEETVLHGAKSPETAICVHDEGIFYLSGTLCYYDYDSGDSFVLCSKPNCLHMSQECVAYAGYKATGFALYGDYAYYFRPKKDSQAWELVQVDIQEQYSEVLTEFGADGSKMEQWVIKGIIDCYYYGGKVWLHMSLDYQTAEDNWWNSQGNQLAAIDLSTGEFYEITEIYEENGSYWYMSYGNFDAAYVGYEILTVQPEIMSAEAFAESVGVDVASLSEEEYWEYVFQNKVEENVVLDLRVIDLQTMESVSVFKDKGEKCLAESIYWTDEKYAYVAEQLSDDNIERYRIISIDLRDGSKEEVLRFENGGALGWYMGEASLNRYNGEDLLYLEYEGEDKCNIYKYSVSQGTSEWLFEDVAEVSFRIVGQTKDRLVGKLNEGTQYAWIYKADYEKGNLDAVKKFWLF